LNLITFFTTQSDILQAWTIERGSTADDAAGIIHTDFQEKFIKVEVIAWQDLVKADSMRKAREAGLVRTEGKNYQVQDGDVLHIKI
jgi:ribosome-binding ATPase YchF (GTP1/OBG family)